MSNDTRSIEEENIILSKYKIYIDYIRHENALINQRTTWLVIIQAALLTVLAGLVSKYVDATQAGSSKILTSPFHDLTSAEQKLFTVFMAFWALICMIGIIASAVSLTSILAADKAQQTLKARWEKKFRQEAYEMGLPDVMGGGDPKADKKGAWSAKMIAILMISIWVVLFLFEAAFLIQIRVGVSII